MNNENIGHNFVYGKNGKGSNFESRNNVLFSYSNVLAMKLNSGIILISDAIATYSSSSSRHALHLNRAIGYGTDASEKTITIYRNDLSDLSHFENKRTQKAAVKHEVSHAIETIKDLLIKQSRARKHNYFLEIENYIENTEKIIENFGIDKRSAEFKEFLIFSDLEELKNNYTDIIQVHKDNEEKKRKKEINKQHAKRSEKIEYFTGMSKQELKNYTKKELANYDFLNVKKDQLCTSRNLCVDLREARILYKSLLAGKDIIGQKIGYYTIISHNKNMVKIGCHNILIKELHRIFNIDSVQVA